MDRRRFLGSATGALATVAGCVEAPRPRRSTPSPPTASPDPGLQRVVRLVDAGGVPESSDVAIDVTVVEPRVTDGHPARLEVTTTNRGPARSLPVGPGGCGPFDRWDGGNDDPPSLWLYDPGYAESIPHPEGRWTPTTGFRQGFGDYGCPLRTYETGASVTNAYVLWDVRAVPGYLTPGVYRWTWPVEVFPPDPAPEDPAPTATFEWHFDLRVAEP